MLVLEQLPSHYRLRVASRVCKLWRRAALLCTHTIKLRSFDRAADLLTALTRLSVSIAPQSRVDSFCVPTTLTALSIRCQVERDEPWGVEPPFPSGLTELSLRSEGLVEGTAELLLANIGTLQTLELVIDQDWLEHLAEPLSMHYTSLTSLSLHAEAEGTNFAPLTPFLSTHCVQLRSLSIHRVHDHSEAENKSLLREAASLCYPSLTRLALFVQHTPGDTNHWLCVLVASASRLSELTLVASDLLEDKRAQACCAPSLTPLSLPSLSLQFLDAAIWPKLRSIDQVIIANSQSASNFAKFCSANRYGGLLRCVRFGQCSSDVVHPIVRLFTNLTSIRLDVLHNAAHHIFPLPAVLRHVTKLKVIEHHTFARLADFVACLAPSCPNLARVVGSEGEGITMERLWQLRSECPSLLYLRVQEPRTVTNTFDLTFSRTNLAGLPFQLVLVPRVSSDDSSSEDDDDGSVDLDEGGGNSDGDSDDDSEAREREEARQYQRELEAERRRKWQPDIRLSHW